MTKEQFAEVTGTFLLRDRKVSHVFPAWTPWQMTSYGIAPLVEIGAPLITKVRSEMQQGLDAKTGGSLK